MTASSCRRPTSYATSRSPRGLQARLYKYCAPDASHDLDHQAFPKKQSYLQQLPSEPAPGAP
eukprot:6057638-Pyramimonas_sp.AAC.2